MATPNRASLINRVLKVVRKHYKPVPAAEGPHAVRAPAVRLPARELAARAGRAGASSRCKHDYFDWNEVRVSTIRELTEVTKPLVDPPEAAARLKQTLHSVFEGVYQFDLETLKKQNIGASAKQLEKYNGSTPFVVAYVTQNALGGHSIPVNQRPVDRDARRRRDLRQRVQSGTVPGLERTVPKNKGVEVGSLLHQLGVEIGRNPYGPNARKLLLEIDPKCKDRLPKRKPPEPPAPPPAPPAPAPAKGKAAAKESKDDKKKAAAKSVPAPAPAPPSKKAKEAAAAKKKPPAKPVKRPTKSGTKMPTKKKATTTKLTKRKPK